MEFVTLSGMCLQDIQVSADRLGDTEVGDSEYTELNPPLFCEAPRLDGLRH